MGKLDAIDADSLLDDFAGEAGAHIEKIESAFLDTDALAGSPALLDGVFRAAHSLKGTAGFFALDKIVAVAHALESVFTRLKSGELALSDEIADAALRSADCLRALVENRRAPGAVDVTGVLALLKGFASARKPEEETAAAPEARMPFDLGRPVTRAILESAEKRGQRPFFLDIRFDKSLGRYYDHPEGLMEDILSVGALVEAAADGAAIEAAGPSELAAKVSDALTKGRAETLALLVTSVLEPELFLIAVELDGRFVHPVSRGAAAPPPEAPAPAALSEQGDGFKIQLDVAVVNGLMDLANEMILTRNQLLSSLSDHRKSVAGLSPVLHDMDRLTGEIQERVMRARMQPAGLVFKKFPRMIRDIAKSLGKDIQIVISGDGVALDKYLLDALSDPLAQIVKNAADHGIETPERRAAAGKPPKGTIVLSARLRDGSAIVEVSDDGAGIDPEALRRKGLERGIAAEERLAAMTGPALFSLIFEPGFSTAKEVTNLSGRGVGMDIVKTNIDKLGGSVEVESEPGRGTKIRLRAPLTLSVVRTLVVEIGGAQYAVPEASVERIVRASPASGESGGKALKRLEPRGSSLELNLDGWAIPVAALPETGAAAREGVVKCLVLKAADKYFALLIDDAVKTEETLIKPVPVYLRGCRCYSGATVLGSGRAVMVLDAEGVMRQAGTAGAGRRPAPAETRPAGDVRRLVVFQCSDAEYFALDMEKVERIERIASGDIRTMGGRQFADVGGKSVRVLRAEDYAPVRKPGCEGEKLCLLMLAAGAPRAGILAARVLDQIERVFPADEGLAYRKKNLTVLNAAEIMKNIDLGAPPPDQKAPQGDAVPLTPLI